MTSDQEARMSNEQKEPSGEAIIRCPCGSPPCWCFDAGREAAMARTCEWRWQNEDDGPVEGWLPGCGGPEQVGDFYEGMADEVWNFCQHCGGRIVVAGKDRGTE